MTAAAPSGNAMLSGAGFLQDMERSFQAAVQTVGGASVVQMRIGTGCVRFCHAGASLAKVFLDALQHHAWVDLSGSDAQRPELEVRLWDAESTGVFAPPPPWQERDFLARGEVRHRFDGGIQLSFRIDSGILSVFDPDSQIAYCWIRSIRALPPWELAAPFRAVLGWWATSTNRQLAHGAAVGTPDGAVLISARGGSGKSTTALSAIERGMLYLGDDYVLLESPADPWVASLYCTAKVQPANLEDRLPGLAALAAAVADPSQDKVTLNLSEAFASQLVDRLPLRAIVVPRVGDNAEPWLEPVSPTTVLSALAPTTVLQLPGADGASLARMGAFVSALPGFRLHLSPRLDANVALLRELITEHATRP